MKAILKIGAVALLATTFGMVGCRQKTQAESEKIAETATAEQPSVTELPAAKVSVNQEITIENFFQFLEKVVRENDTLTGYQLTENLLLRANPWILDTLVNTDYYVQMARGNFVYDQTKMTVLRPGDTLLIPGPKTAADLLAKMTITRLDINIPAFELRILEGDSVLHRMPVRVGKNQKKFLELAGAEVNLRTRTGEGEIIRINRFPVFYDPETGDQFKFTRRDDRRTTLMPQIPWLEPVIDGHRYGQMLHPTTNPRTLGKAASNGCIGTGEADAWRVYFYAPVGTKVTVRYDLEEINEQRDTLRYKDIYQLQSRSGKVAAALLTPPLLSPDKTVAICQCDDVF